MAVSASLAVPAPASRSGGTRGRRAPGKTPFIAAVETTGGGKPVRLILRRITSFCATAISGFAKRSLDPDCSVVSDGLQCFARVADAGCEPGQDPRLLEHRHSNGSI
jgi:hypothetical protein